MGANNQQQTATSNQTIDPNVMGNWQALYNRAQYQAAMPYQQAPPSVAGWSPMQRQAQSYLAGAFGGAPSAAVNSGRNLDGVASASVRPPPINGMFDDQVQNTVRSTLQRTGPGGLSLGDDDAAEAGVFGQQYVTDPSTGERTLRNLTVGEAKQIMGAMDAPSGGGMAGGNGIGEAMEAANVARGIAAGGATPMVRPMMLNPGQADYSGDVSAERVGAGNPLDGMMGYQNAYDDQVVNASLSDIDRSRQITQQQNASNATQAGAFGGDRHAIVEAETNRAYADQAARTAAQLRSQGFNTAANFAQADASRGLQAGVANQSAGLQAGVANQGARNAMSQYNTSLGFDAARANQGAGLTADQANQNAWFTGRDQQLQGAGLLSGFGGDIFNRTVGAADAMYNMGAREQDQQQRVLDDGVNRFREEQQYPWQNIGYLQSILSGMPYGTSSTQSMTMPRNRGAGIAGGALSGAGIGSSFGPWGAGIGAIGGGLLGLFG